MSDTSLFCIEALTCNLQRCYFLMSCLLQGALYLRLAFWLNAKQRTWSWQSYSAEFLVNVRLGIRLYSWSESNKNEILKLFFKRFYSNNLLCRRKKWQRKRVFFDSLPLFVTNDNILGRQLILNICFTVILWCRGFKCFLENL